jgi:cell division transport system permease protein
MKKGIITFYRVIRAGLINFIRNLSLATAAIAIMSVTLTIVLFLVIANATFSNTIAQINSKINISVYLSDSATTLQVQTLESQLRKLPNVKSVSYVSKDEALAEYRSENATNTGLLEAINETGNPLPASVQIEPRDISKIQDIKVFLDKPANLALQDSQVGSSYSGDRKAAIDKIAKTTSLLREAGIIGVALFAIISTLIIFNTLRMAIFNRRDEIQIMRLLGATTWYIRGPFVVESVAYGVIAALVSVGFIRAVFTTASSALQASSFGLLDIGYSSTYFSKHFWLLLTLQLAVGILLGAVSSVIATRRFLKFKSHK